MKRSCYALTWLMGTLAGCLMAVNVVSGQHPPAGAPDDAPDDGPASQQTIDDRPAVTAVTAGPLGWLPYDDEYHCEVPSENPDALPSLSIWDGVRVVEAAPIGPFDSAAGVSTAESEESEESVAPSPSAVTIVTSTEAGSAVVEAEASAEEFAEESAEESAETGAAIESVQGEGALPFRVLGYGASEESGADESDVDSEVDLTQRVAAGGSPVAVAWMRGFARTLQAAGDWFDSAAGSLEARTDLAVGE